MNAKANGVDVLAVPSVLAVLVPVDGSALSKTALLAADELAERLKLEVHLMTAVPHESDVPAAKRRLAAMASPDRPVHCSSWSTRTRPTPFVRPSSGPTGP